MASAQSLLPLFRRYPIASVCLGLTVLTAAGFAFRFSALDESQQELDRIRGEAETLRRNVRNSTDLEQHLQRLNAGLAKLDARLVKETDLATNLERFYRIEAETGVKMSVQQAATAVRKNPPKSGLVPVGFSVSVDGPFVNVVNFVGALERGPFEYRVVSFSVLPAGRGRESADASASSAERVALNMQLELLGTP